MKLYQWLVVGLSLPIFVGCASNVNLIQYHQGMARWDDTPAQLEARYKENLGLYTEIINATSAPNLAPYPTMQSNLDSMKRYADQARRELRNIHRAKKNFQSYAYSQRTVTSKEEIAWAEFEKQRAEYAAYHAAMSSHVGGFNRALKSFHRSMRVHDIKKTSNQELRAQVDGMMENFNRESRRMEESMADKVSRMAFGRLRGGPALNRRRRYILREMDDVLTSLPPLRLNMSLLDESASVELSGHKHFWTGPGMTRTPSVVARVARTYKEFKKVQIRFAKLEAEFEKLGKPHPHGVHPKTSSPPGTTRAGSAPHK